MKTQLISILRSQTLSLYRLKVSDKISACAFVLMTVLTGCSLEEVIHGSATTDGFITSEADVPFVVNGVYAGLQDFNSFKTAIPLLTFYAADDFSNQNITTGASAGLYLTRQFTSSDNYIRNGFNMLYSTINRANSAIEAITPVESVKASTKNQVIGEMKFVRAFTYFHLVRLFGGVPVKTEATRAGSNFYGKRNTVDEVYSQIFKDFKEASAACLPYSKQPANEGGRATKGAAQALLSLAYLTYANHCDFNSKPGDAQKNFGLAAEYADSVLNSNEYTLLSNYANLFDIGQEKNAYREVIYGIQFTRDPLTPGAPSKGSEWAYYHQPNTRIGICGNLPTGKGAALIKIHPWFYDLYVSGDYAANGITDYRTEVSFLTRWNGTTSANLPRRYITYPVIEPDAPDLVRENQPYLDKYKDPNGKDARNNENDLFVIRLAEIYLIKAEALNELGRTAEAYEAFNKVRQRARMANGTPRNVPVDLAVGLSKEEFRLAVFNERGLELVGEGHRWFDAIRMRYLNTEKTMLQWRLDTFYPNLPATTKTLPVWNTTAKSWQGGRVQPITVTAWSDRFKLFPIPSTELDANPAFGTQNQGW